MVGAIAGAEAVLDWVRIYVAAGCVVAAPFLVFGVGRVCDEARGSWLFRLVILPGVVGLWPVVLCRWLQLELKGGRP